jgi:ABC-type molybdate transport system substrate-binding protein
VVARYPIAVVNGAKGRQLARAFIEYLVGEDGQRLLAGFGFSRP